ncbi:MAG: ABC transporter substrate-binding protein [Paracoccaceae bacterium]
MLARSSFDTNRRRLLQMIAAGATLPLIAGAPRAAFAATGDVILRLDQDLTNLDPANRTGTVEDALLQACSQTLARFNPGTLDWSPDAAKVLTQVSETEITFELNPGQMFQGGYGEMTAEDVKFTFERFLPAPDGSKPAYADDWKALDKVEVTGTYTGRILLKQPAPALWMIGICDGSGAILSKKAVEDLGDKLATTIVGTGPYMLSDWVPNTAITLTANPDYKGGDMPAFQRIILKPITEFRSALLAFQAGEIAFTEVDPTSIPEARAIEGGVILEKESIDYTWIGLNIRKKPLDDLRVRQAIRLAIDMDVVVQGAYGGSVTRAKTLLAPGLMGHWAAAPLYARDLDAARALLAEAGADGISLTFTCLNDSTSTATAAIVQANLADVGIAVTVNALDGGAYWAMGDDDKSADLEMTLITYAGKFDPGFQTQWFTGDQVGLWNWQGWADADFDTLQIEAGKITDPALRAPMYIKMQEILDASATCLWITHGSKIFLHRADLDPVLLPNGSNWQLRFFRPV